MIKGPERTCLFDSDEIIWLFDDADDRTITFRVRTVMARIDICNIVANRAKNDLFLDLKQRCDEVINFCLGTAKNVKGQPLRRLAANAWQAFEFVDEASHGFGIVKHFRFLICDSRLLYLHTSDRGSERQSQI